MNEAPWMILLVVLLIPVALKILNVILKRRDAKKQKKIEAPAPKSGLDIESMSNGSVQVIASGKKTIIRLSGGARFRGTINGKRIEVDVPSYKAWEEIVIEA